MKKLFAFVLIILPLIANAGYYDVQINGIFYKLNNDSKEAIVVMGCTEIREPSSYPFPPFGPVAVASYSGNVVIPESIEYRGSTYSITQIEGQVRSLESFESYGAFEGCKDLTSITIPKTIKKIGHQAFAGCTSLQSVYISDLTAWCNISFNLHDRYGNYFSNANPLSFAHNLYLNGNKISNLTIPDKVTTINNGTFIGCNLSSVSFHKSVNKILDYSFDECSNLNDVYSYSPKILADYTSFNSHESKTLHIRKRYQDNYLGVWQQFGKIEYIEEYDYNLIYKVDGNVYKQIVMEVGEAIVAEPDPQKEGYTFSGWSEIPEIMPDHDVTITGSFSANTYKLTYNVDGNEYKVYDVKYDEAITPEAIPVQKGKTFSGWSEIPQRMPAHDVTVTGTFSWSKTTKSGVVYQVYDADKELVEVVRNDKASGEIVIESPVEIGGNNYSVATVTDRAFSGCSGITKITIPATITKIGERAFAKIDKLTDVTIYAEDIPETDRTAFENSYIEDYVTLHVPESAIEKYKAAAPWKNFKEVVVEKVKETKCATPTIELSGGKIVFNSTTEGVKFISEVTASVSNKYEQSEITPAIPKTFKVSVYAIKDGLENSETVTKEFKFSDIGLSDDQNGDGVVNAADVVRIVNRIMNLK